MKIVPFKNEIDFAFASKEHGPWLMNVGFPGVYNPVFANDRYVNIILNNIDVEIIEVPYEVLLKDWRWIDGTECGQEINV